MSANETSATARPPISTDVDVVGADRAAATSAGNPCGSAPSTDTPARAARSNAATASVAPTTAIRMAGTRGQRLQQQDRRERACADRRARRRSSCRRARRSTMAHACRSGPSRVDRETEELRQLAEEHRQRDAVHVAVADRLREQLGHEAEAREARRDAHDARDDRHRAGQRDRALRVARRQRQHDREDHGRQRGVRAEHEDAARAEHRVGEQRHDRRVEAVDARHARRLRIRDADRHQHRRQHEPGDDVVAQPGALVASAGCAAPGASAAAAMHGRGLR